MICNMSAQMDSLYLYIFEDRAMSLIHQEPSEDDFRVADAGELTVVRMSSGSVYSSGSWHAIKE